MIPPNGLESLFKHFKRKNIHIKVVVLNACYSEDQAMAIANQVPYVIGTTVSIEDGLAISFSTGFYFDLAEFGLDFIEQAFSSGVAQAALDGAEESDFVIYKNGQKLEI